MQDRFARYSNCEFRNFQFVVSTGHTYFALLNWAGFETLVSFDRKCGQRLHERTRGRPAEVSLFSPLQQEDLPVVVLFYCHSWGVDMKINRCVDYLYQGCILLNHFLQNTLISNVCMAKRETQIYYLVSRLKHTNIFYWFSARSRPWLIRTASPVRTTIFLIINLLFEPLGQSIL